MQRVGSLQIWMSRAEMQETLASIRKQLESQQGMQIKRMRGLLAGITLPLLVLGLIGAWFIARQLARPISALVKSADRIGQGDYTRPLDVVRHDELGDLQFALERMRQKLNETTITKNYLNTVLNSLSDAVLVTSPDGIVKSCNEATQTAARLPGSGFARQAAWSSFIDEAHRNAFDLTQLGAGGARDRAAHRQRPDHSGLHGQLRRSPRQIRSSRATSTWRAISPSASAPNGASAIWRATTRSPRCRIACSSSICCSRRSRARGAASARSRCSTWIWIGSRRSTTPSATPPAIARWRS